MEISKLEVKKNDIDKITFLNIDSRNRNKNPRNILDNSQIFLDKDPITVTEDSNLVKIKFNSHNFSVGDKIVIQNVNGDEKTLISSLRLVNNFNYIFVNFIDHNIDENYLKYQSNFEIKIEIKDDLGVTDYKKNNIYLNSFIGIQNAIYCGDVTLPDNIETILSDSTDNIKKNYFLIKLPYDYVSTNDSDLIDFMIQVTFLNIANIPLKYINSNYPINYKQYQGFQEISQIDTNYIYYKSKIKAYKSLSSGGSKINISKVIRTNPGYPNANDYTINLKNNFTNIESIRMVCSEIPYADLLIKSSGSNKNNLLYWKQYEDGDHIYSIEIGEGNYNSAFLTKELQSLMNNVERINSTEKNPIYNEFHFEIGPITDTKNNQDFKVNSYQTLPLPDSITVNKETIDDEEYYTLTIKHENNILGVGDKIKILNSLQIDNIPEDQINTVHEIYSVDRTNHTYKVLLNYVNISDTSVSGNGGKDVLIKMKSLVSFLFDKPFTIGKLVGFKNVGEPNAITKFSHITYNTGMYIYDNNLDSVGNQDTEHNIINLESEYSYMFLYLNDYENVSTGNSLSGCFAKIQLCGTSGNYLFNKHITKPYKYPIASMSELRVVFLNQDGTKPDFRNLENSFTLEIREKISVNNFIGINSKNTSYEATVKNLNL
jgi:hypothetical protein